MDGTSTSETKKLVLIVDDEENLRHVLRLMLEQYGYTVFEAVDGHHAISVLDEQPEVRMVLCDLRMPKLDGLGFLHAVENRGLSVIMMSAYGTTETAERALGLGAVDTISKPFRPAEIRARLDRLFDSTALADENQRLRDAVRQSSEIEGFDGQSPAARRVVDLVLKVAPYPDNRADHRRIWNRERGPRKGHSYALYPSQWTLCGCQLWGHSRELVGE